MPEMDRYCDTCRCWYRLKVSALIGRCTNAEQVKLAFTNQKHSCEKYDAGHRVPAPTG